MNTERIRRVAAWLPLAAVAALLAAGCSRNEDKKGASSPLSPGIGASRARASAPAILTQDGAIPPAGVLAVGPGADPLRLWPYTGASFNGVPSDPVNLLFAGNADPIRIRAALLALDGDRSAFGFPAAHPFNARWSDAIGDVQTVYAEGEGWQPSVIQLQLGTYEPVRVHLRLFRTGVPFRSPGTWTVGAAHFEVLIPGTAEHQVLSWELAQQLVVADFVRSGLLDPAAPLTATDAISETPSFRTIPEAIYNGLPEGLKAAIGGPAGPVAAPVPISNDGQATILFLAGEAALSAGDSSDGYTLTYNQVIPKPICSDGPLDWVLVSGPVELSRSTSVDASGRYRYRSRVAGRLTVTPVDVTQNPPAPTGASYEAEISDLQEGASDPGAAWALAEVKRIAPQSGGTELLTTRLRAASNGPDAYRAQSLCP